MTPPAWLAVDAADAAAHARTWLASPALRALAETLGGPSTDATEELLRWSETLFDTRRGVERRDALAVTWDRAHVDAILTAAGPLGLLNTAGPQRDSYDATLLLGGTTTGNRMRTRLAASLASQRVHLGLIAGVTAERTIGPREHETEPESVADATEWRHLLRCIEESFGPLTSKRTLDWREQRFSTSAGQPVRVLVAPPIAARARATTADGIRFFLDRVDASSTLLVTSAIYAPYQYFAVAPLLIEGGVRHVELIGTPTAADADRRRLAQRIAQEIHAALRAAAALI